MARPIDLRDAAREKADAQSFQRGREYARQGAVRSITRRRDTWEARVKGSRPRPYRVEFRTEGGAFRDASCSCPMGQGAFCKHIVAALLVAAEHPERVDEAPDLEEALRKLSEGELRRLILDAAAARPGLRLFLDARMPGLISPAVERRKAAESSSGAATHKQASKLLHSLDRMRRSEAYWHVEEVLLGLDAMVEACTLRAAGGFTSDALESLGGLTAAYAEEWRLLDDSGGGPGGFWYRLGDAWAELLGLPDVEEPVRAMWRKTLRGYETELVKIGLVKPLEAAILGRP